ncbi:hypothetical protein [Fuchsiella alkaliacetigena]|uniref:hypothetical protein n=1 Tax=Fuchsiella alkaliacetigena TaxID=957042 RepID=UPI00200B174C|nr:hypothetical protein [Fuchsiella alkaliacetigena]MCK8825254.1 hypothetical protein [Fuchsiella alkaliacetigena]
MAKQSEEITMFIDRSTEKVMRDIVDLLSEEIYSISSEVMDDYNDKLEDNIWQLKDKIDFLKRLEEQNQQKIKEQGRLNEFIEEKLSVLDALSSNLDKIASQTKETENISDKLDDLKVELSQFREGFVTSDERLLSELELLKEELSVLKTEINNEFENIRNQNKQLLFDVKDKLSNNLLKFIEKENEELKLELEKMVNETKEDILTKIMKDMASLKDDYKEDIKEIKDLQVELKEIKLQEEKVEKLPGLFKFLLGSRATLWIAEKLGL